MSHISQAELLNKFDLIAVGAASLDDDISRMYELALTNDILPLFYLCAPLSLSVVYSSDDVEQGLLQFAYFDSENESSAVRAAAKSYLSDTTFCKSKAKFVSQVTVNGLSGFITNQDVLYVAHRCTKPDSKPWQVTVFAKGLGPISDSQFDSVEQIVTDGIVGAGIPSNAKYVPANELISMSSMYCMPA